MTAAIHLQQVTHRFANGVDALQPLDLNIEASSAVCLLGPSGCGKTTLLRLVAGLAPATAGQVQITATKPRLSYVFQEATLLPWASVFDNVWLPLRIEGVDRHAARQRIEPLLERLGLAEFAQAQPHQLSGGMKMRCSIARALVTQPDVLLMDEPFAALDEITRQRLNDDLLALWQAQRFTLLFVTHSVFEAAYLAQRIVVFSARPGRVIADMAVTASYPRTAWRHQAAYVACCNQASAALHAGMPHAHERPS